MSSQTIPNLQSIYNERQDVLEVRSAEFPADVSRLIEPGIILHYCSHNKRVVGITVEHFLDRFPLVACTLPVEDHGAAVAREYMEKFPVLPA